MEFKKLELEPEKRGFKGWIRTKQFRTSVISVIIGAAAGFGYYFLGEAQTMEGVVVEQALKYIAMGGVLGFFVTNSPCARGRC